MRPDRAWVRLQSGKRLDLLDPDMASWEDRDLAIGLSRTYRWGGHSRWDLPLSVAQHSLLVLVLRQQMQPHAPLDRDDALRELLHDGHEGFLSFDPISPVKPHLGPEFEDVAGRLQAAIGRRYGLPAWKGDDHVLHKRADRLAAASEALHVAGWSRRDLHETLGIELVPVMDDPLPRLKGFRPWEPWPAKLAAALFLAKLRELTDDEAQLDRPAALEGVVERERTIASLHTAFCRLPPAKQRRCKAPLTGSSLTDTYVLAEADNGSQHVEGVVVDGVEIEGDGWDFAQEFIVFTNEEEFVTCYGWNLHVQVQ